MDRWRPDRERRGCRILVAAAGYGKTTALRRRFPPDAARWHRGVGSGLSGLVRAAVDAAHPVVVFDDLPRPPAAEIDALLETVGALPEPVTVVLAARAPLPAPPARWLGRGLWTELGPPDLVLAPEQVADLIGDEYGLREPGVAELVHEATGGWPALVQLTAESIRLDGRAPGPLAAAVARPGGPLARYLTDQVLAELPEQAARLLRVAGGLSPVTAGLCRALGHPDADRTVDTLRRTGLLTQAGSVVIPNGPAPAERVVPVVAEVVRQCAAEVSRQPTADRRGRRERRAQETVAPAAPDCRAPAADETARVAAAWYDRHGPALSAALAYRQADDLPNCARVLTERGAEMIAAGRAEPVAELLATLPAPLMTRPLRLLHGDALRTLGDLPGAEHAYRAAAAAQPPPGTGPGAAGPAHGDGDGDGDGAGAGHGDGSGHGDESGTGHSDGDGTGGPAWDAGLAWRVGRIAYQRGDARAALAAFGRAAGGSAAPLDAALLQVWTAHAHLLAGDTGTAIGYARRAAAIAADAGLDNALATAHLSVALCLGVAGDAAGAEEYYALALPIAERTADVLLLARIHTNRTYHLIRTARYAPALETARQSARYAAAAGSPSLSAIATCNEADALAMLGRYDEAVRRYEAALTRYQRKGSRRFAAALLGLGEVHRRRGWQEQARAAYEEAVRVAEQTGNVHVLVPALAGLALASLPDDPKAAAGHAEQASRHAADDIAAPAVVAQGWVALHDADPGTATELAARAARLARTHHDRAGLAEALELRAAADDGPDRRRALLGEARAIWTEAGATVEAARLTVALGRLPDAGTDARLDGLLAAERLTAAGAVVDRAASVCAAPGGTGGTAAEVAVRALGRFEVIVGGRPVPASQWQSRKARDLVRILVARRGRPVPRGELCDLLWPEDPPERTGHRLSVLLSIIRGVLDPAKVFSPDHFLVADQSSIALEVARVRVDVEEFLAQVAHGRRLLDRGAVPEAAAVLAAADRGDVAEAFADEPYADWSVPLREETRAAYLAMLRMLAQTRRMSAGPGAAVGYLLRLLEQDPYDEPAHRALVRALVAGGQHGEARRAFRRYEAAMREIGVRPPTQVLLQPAHRDPASR
ncbi:BTAD domain-containing putative transcriptional regulator [Solwaraspora sp. WMMD1047]|uniref:BTAD domain-containing putative transcriptional regulator n=1 Tax=Solwaraspora sp. WMMD1047 TaxID=3016102 RepID=UPI0024171892|nr:BTAD domain-containing putative transcriptional regulator [Solwaraspora sp. WMMD1047]MDG4831495.1 BTAD domain-containing putative transcriptional regulator [Solwaraspora sp. WMMD1047]